MSSTHCRRGATLAHPQSCSHYQRKGWTGSTCDQCCAAGDGRRHCVWMTPKKKDSPVAEQCTERRAQVGRELVASGVDKLVGELQVVVRQRCRDPLRCHRRRRDARLLMVHPVDEPAGHGEVDNEDDARVEMLDIRIRLRGWATLRNWHIMG
eukprot:gene16344-biopygen5894